MSSTYPLLGALVVGLLSFGRLRRLAPGVVAPRPGRPVVLIVPARNEEASLGNLLADVAAQTRRPEHVVVVDDHSTDGTRSIADSFATSFARVSVLAAPALPPGWRGKTWACHQGARTAVELAGTDALLVFVDADVRLREDAVEALVAASSAGGVVSVQPFHEAPAGMEQLSAVFNLVSLMGVGAGTRHPSAIFGPVICCRAADYRRVDGHRSVASAIAEDVELGHRFLRAGLPISVLGGGPVVRFRMYPTGVRSLIEGWSKNMATGATSVRLWRTLAVAWWITGLVMASTTYVGLVVDGILHRSAPAPGAVGVVVATGVVLGILLRQVGSFRAATIIVFPVPVMFFVAVFLRSVWLTYVRRSVEWRGRTLDLTGDRGPSIPRTMR